jgi:hypothetical protein
VLAALLAASGAVASFAACPHAAREGRGRAAAAHDCCRARHARANGHDAGPSQAHHAAAGGVIRSEPEDARRSRDIGCASARREGDSARVEFQDDSDAPCAECCAPRLARTNSPAVASPRGASRAGDANDATAPRSPTFVPPQLYEFAPTQHPPPAPRARPHALNSVLLI